MRVKNFRDIAKFNSKIKLGIIYRSAALYGCDKSDLNAIFQTHNIGTIIDLRADRELTEHQLKARLVHIPFDPWAQSVRFKNTHNTGTNVEIAYHFFAKECKSSIKIVIETILESSHSVVIHCHSGKDRTGIVITLLHLISGASNEAILRDYLASEMDTQPAYLKILLDIIDQSGGITPYLRSCKLSTHQIQQLTQKICTTQN